ncbi:MAG: DUF188 domain-containing protein [Treponema sp.]|nr:DUF188 domain-containing protein [Candidatus Treponema caballi]
MEKSFSLWVDADSCPAPARDIIIRFSKRLSLECWFVANRIISIPKAENFHMIVTDAEKDAADNYIVENIGQNDIAITRDIPFAARLVEKNITIINDRGTLYNRDNISERLSLRNFNLTLFENGIESEKTSVYGKKELNAFSNCLDREIQKKLRASQTN